MIRDKAAMGIPFRSIQRELAIGAAAGIQLISDFVRKCVFPARYSTRSGQTGDNSAHTSGEAGRRLDIVRKKGINPLTPGRALLWTRSRGGPAKHDQIHDLENEGRLDPKGSTMSIS
jgi:hypothetical protein